MRKALYWLLLCIPAGLGGAFQSEQAESLFRSADYTAARKILLAQSSLNAPGSALLGKVHYMLGEYKEASEALERAVEAQPGSSDYRHWLGKAFGRRAETSSFLTAPGFANKCRQNFEKALELDPKNLSAANDLLEYYLNAPALFGGGLDKAEALARKILPLDEAEYHYALAQLARKRKQTAEVEQHLRRALALSPNRLGRYLDLARFLAQQKRFEESDALFAKAAEMAPGAHRLMYAQAAAWIEGGRNREQARNLLNRYLAAPLTPDDPPRQQAERLLRQLDDK